MIVRAENSWSSGQAVANSATAPSLTFLWHAWMKLHWMCHRQNCEIGGFGLLDQAELAAGRLVVDDFKLVKQTVTAASVQFDDDGLAEYVDQSMMDPNANIERYLRLWIHTHPGDSASPSSVDEHTFSSIFGRYPWAIMMIMSRTTPVPEIYTRLRWTCGPISGATHGLQIRTRYDHKVKVDSEAWEKEFQELVGEKKYTSCVYVGNPSTRGTKHEHPWERARRDAEGSSAGITIGGSGTTGHSSANPITRIDDPSAPLPGWDADMEEPPSRVIVPLPTSGRPVVWYDDIAADGWSARDFKKEFLRDKTHWRDFSKDLPSMAYLMVYKGVATGTFYVWPASEDPLDPWYEPDARIRGRVNSMFYDVPSGKPNHLTEPKYETEVYFIKDAITSGRFNLGRSFQPLQRNSEPTTVEVAKSDDTGGGGDRVPTVEAASDYGCWGD